MSAGPIERARIARWFFVAAQKYLRENDWRTALWMARYACEIVRDLLAFVFSVPSTSTATTVPHAE